MFTSTFPSLYKPQITIGHSIHESIFIDNVRDIYLFTLYWTLIIYTPLFITTGVCATLILVFEPVRRSQRPWTLRRHILLSKTGRPDRLHRRFFIYSILVFLLYVTIGLFMSVLASAVVGFLIAAVYTAGRLRVSTWIPLVWVVTQSLITVTSTCSLVIDIM